MEIFEWFISNLPNIAYIFTIIIGLYGIPFTYFTLRQRKHILSMNAFDRALNEFGSDKARKDRGGIYEHFLPSARFGEEKLVDITTIPFFQQINKNDIRSFKRTAVRADRIGFMFFTLDLSPKFKKQYIDWLCITFCEIWNRLSVHIDEERDWRDIGDRFVPYFEKLAYLCYYRYNHYNRDARIIFLDKNILDSMKREYDNLWFLSNLVSTSRDILR